jgi:hypothetical protein
MGFLAGVAPARPQLRAALRPMTASGSFLTPCLFLPRSTPPSGPAPASASSLASVLRNPPTSSGGAGRRIGHLFRRVRSLPSRFAAGRSRPQQETFRRPTAILVDPATTSAALVHTDFARQSPSPKARPVARNLRAAVAVGEPFPRSLPAGANRKASSQTPKRPAEAQAA